MQEPESLFTGLVENTGKNAAKVLKEMAQASHERGEDNAYTTAHSPHSASIPEDSVPPRRISSRDTESHGISGELFDAHATFGLAMGDTHMNMAYEGSSSDYFGVPGAMTSRWALRSNLPMALSRLCSIRMIVSRS